MNKFMAARANDLSATEYKRRIQRLEGELDQLRKENEELRTQVAQQKQEPQSSGS